MSQLLLNDDDVALLRWTCELFFVPESPLHAIDAEGREPRDFAFTYQDLCQRGVLDEQTFRLTDAALNRMAPLAECDGRVVVWQPGDRGGRPRVRDHYLLDDIAVQYEWTDQMHCVGPDQDPTELATALARRFVPRRAGGDYVDFHLTPQEFLAFCVLAHRARRAAGPMGRDLLLQELRPVFQAPASTEPLTPARRSSRESTRGDATVRHRAAQLMAQAAHEPSPAQELASRSPGASAVTPAPSAPAMKAHKGATARLASVHNGNHADEPGTHGRPAAARSTSNPNARATSVAPAPPDGADAALAGLLKKGVALQGARGLELRPSVQAMAVHLSEQQRCSVVRFDFAEDDWFIRETSFLATDGSLFQLGVDDAGLLWVAELDQARLETALHRAVGALPRAEDTGQRAAKELLLRA